jgi:hypothetical protein
MVCGSARKEAHFFNRDIDFSGLSLKRDYLRLFPSRLQEQKVLLEATPNYLDGGKTIAERMRTVLGDPYILVMLRNPSDRLVSYYRSQQGWTDSPVHGMSFSEFSEQALYARGRNCHELPSDLAEFGLQIRKGEYSRALREYLTVFRKERVFIIFFETFRVSPITCLTEVCGFAGLQEDFYGDYKFPVENQSRYHRSAALRTLSSKANLVLEPFLNRAPWSRRFLRRAYNLMNVTTTKSHTIDKASLDKLEKYFSSYNQDLFDLLTEQGVIVGFPDWVHPPSTRRPLQPGCD